MSGSVIDIKDRPPNLVFSQHVFPDRHGRIPWGGLGRQSRAAFSDSPHDERVMEHRDLAFRRKAQGLYGLAKGSPKTLVRRGINENGDEGQGHIDAHEARRQGGPHELEPSVDGQEKNERNGERVALHARAGFIWWWT